MIEFVNSLLYSTKVEVKACKRELDGQPVSRVILLTSDGRKMELAGEDIKAIYEKVREAEFGAEYEC